MFVTDRDYLRILHGGNFINFVCMVLDKDNKKSMVRTENFRLKVRRSCMLKAVYQNVLWIYPSLSFCTACVLAKYFYLGGWHGIFHHKVYT